MKFISEKRVNGRITIINQQPRPEARTRERAEGIKPLSTNQNFLTNLYYNDILNNTIITEVLV